MMRKSSFMSLQSAALTVAAFTFAGGMAQAADLDQVLYATPADQDVFKPVEIGSGWYLRGDIAYVPSSHAKLRLKGYDWLGTERGEVKATAAYSGGVGYQFTNNIRGDITAGYRKLKASGEPVEADVWEVMANAYYDIGNFSGVTPYVGAGLGMANVDYKVGYKIPDTNDDAFGGRNTTRLQWALMAGAAIDVTENIKFDLGYRYARISSGDAADAASFTFSDKGLESHQIRAGIRMTTW
ncbi:outer membrane protein [Pseudochrobactrum kiredjianiae]|uniref:Outer membrane protein n=1 Tax=Pseudochrobactrum kiredjianiae TaxID=386305 RepID=A0ABW3UXM7_9HYPH|nr:outer membrane protein [Pseudochrobactrum kiredjianiae]MDM7851947.1 porin family protein [Pseudochrobactrum kiredjianiae]